MSDKPLDQYQTVKHSESAFGLSRRVVMFDARTKKKKTSPSNSANTLKNIRK